MADTMQAPSPHRFINSKQRPSSTTKKAQPSSHIAVTSDESRNNYGDAFAGTSQFADAPRFATGRTPAKTPQPDATPRPALVDALRATNRAREDVEESAFQTSDDEEMLDGEQASALPTTEIPDQHNSHRVLPFSPKRRRIGDTNSVQPRYTPAKTHVEQTFAKPRTPASAQRPAIPRFSTTAGTSLDNRDDISSQPRPAFLRPSLAPNEASEPLPEAFSPHRRGQKFVPGGMAATVQQWVVETGQAAIQSRRGRAYLRGDDFELKFSVIDCTGTGPFMVTARTTADDQIHVLLICAATAAEQANTVKIGAMIGVRAPTWDTAVEGVTWRVGVDWRVI